MTRLMPARSSSDLREIIGTTVIAPPDQAYVTLSEAVSWAAFGASMDASKLARCLGMERKPTKSRRRYQRDIVLDRAIEIGIERLIDLARRNELKLQGRFFPSILSDDREILVQPIGAVGLANYQRFEVSGDILYRGRGVAWQTLRRDLPPVSDDHYRDVTVERGDLLKVFPSPAQAPNMTCYTVKAEQACERWLNNAFRNDPFKKRAKASFRTEALSRFAPSLAVRGFDRAWAKVAPDAGRNIAGAKSRQRFDSPI